MAREGSKRQIAIEVMTANADKPMDDVLPLIMDQCDLKNLGAARGYYKHIAEMGWAPGTVPASTRGRKPKIEAPADAASTEQVTAAPVAEVAPPSEEEVDAIRAANLAKLQQLAARRNQVEETDEADDEEFDEEIDEEEVAAADDDSDEDFPESLTAEQVAALV